MRSWVAQWFLVAIAAAMFLYYGPLLLSNASSQDDCTFGLVSNDRYRALLAKAKKIPGPTTKNIRGELDARFKKIAWDSTSVYDRLAAMHASIRSFGGVYIRTRGQELYFPSSPENPYERFDEVSFEYQIDLNRLGEFSLFGRTAYIFSEITSKSVRSVTGDRKNPGDIWFRFVYPNFKSSLADSPISGRDCPLVPSETRAEGFSLAR